MINFLKRNRFGRGSTHGINFTHDNLNIDFIYKLNQNQFPQNAISHKELNDFLINAKKNINVKDASDQNKIKEEQDFNDLITKWTETSQKILLLMNNKEKVFNKNKNPKSLMAFGAMGAHINMALQALKATGSDQ